MKIGIGITVLVRSLLTGGVDGIGSYTRELVNGLAKEEDIELLPYSFGYRPPDCLESYLRADAARHRLRSYVPAAVISALTGRRFHGLNRIAGSIPDLIHATDHLIPKTGSTRLIASLMDAFPLSHPDMVPDRLRRCKNLLWKKTARWADHVITISNYSKEQIQQHFGLPSERISVIPLGVDERWFRSVEARQATDTVASLNLPDNYFLFVGTLQPRKNLERLVAAHLALPDAVRAQVPLLIVGRVGWKSDHLVGALTSRAYGSSVRWLKHLPDETLQVVLQKATALVAPSLYEGFGLPVLEAFASQTPVITSNISALPEVAQGAAILVDPESTDDISQAMLQMLEDQALAEELRQKGLQRAKAYSWERTVALTVELYRNISGRN